MVNTDSDPEIVGAFLVAALCGFIMGVLLVGAAWWLS